VLNNLDRRVQPKPVPVDASGRGLPGGNLRSPRPDQGQNSNGRLQGRQYLFGDGSEPGSETGTQATLEGVPSDQWQSGQSSGQGESRQYAVMVIQSPVSPVYAADGYFGLFDPVAGFQQSPDQPLNDLVHEHLIQTWTNSDESGQQDLGRSPVPIFYLSTIPDRVLAYRPSSVEPTVLNREYYPFSYSYDSVSLMSFSNGPEMQSIAGLSPEEEEELAPYLQIPLDEKDRAIFQSYLGGAVGSTTGYYDRIMAILKSFSKYQYQVGFSNDVSVKHLVDFLTVTKNGDCVEFSNTAAILARLVGIPSRVVTGYLASKDLQTFAHRRGLALLREKIPLLQKFPSDQLYLVTTAHRHSWVQLYMPGYGWVDFETTSYAIPPAAGGDPNSWNVVIPLLNGQKELSPLASIPWLLLLQVLLVLIAAGLAFMYLYRYGRELYLLNLSRGRTRRSLDAMYKLLLLRLVANGFSLKSPAKTAREYAQDYPEIEPFAALYTELRYRELFAAGERERLWNELKREYRAAARTGRHQGILGTLRRSFSLRGLSYRW